jgi:hypothetical protein
MNTDFKPWPTEELYSLREENKRLKELLEIAQRDLVECARQRDEYKEQLDHLDR